LSWAEALKKLVEPYKFVGRHEGHILFSRPPDEENLEVLGSPIADATESGLGSREADFDGHR